MDAWVGERREGRGGREVKTRKLPGAPSPVTVCPGKPHYQSGTLLTKDALILCRHTVNAIPRGSVLIHTRLRPKEPYKRIGSSGQLQQNSAASFYKDNALYIYNKRNILSAESSADIVILRDFAWLEALL